MYDDWCCRLNGHGCFCNIIPTEDSMGCLECGKNSGKELFCSNECYVQFNSNVVPSPTGSVMEDGFPPPREDEVPF